MSQKLIGNVGDKSHVSKVGRNFEKIKTIKTNLINTSWIAHLI